jgi:hypothetical protein
MSLTQKHLKSVFITSIQQIVIMIIMLSGIFLFPALTISSGNDDEAILLTHSDDIEESTTFIDSSVSTNVHTITSVGDVHHEIYMTPENVCNASNAIGHIHARNPDGTPTQAPEPFAEIIEKVRYYCPSIIIGVSTSGRADPSFQGRSRVLEIPGIDSASLTVNSVQFPQRTVMAKEETIIRLFEKCKHAKSSPNLSFLMLVASILSKDIKIKSVAQTGRFYATFFLGILLQPRQILLI